MNKESEDLVAPLTTAFDPFDNAALHAYWRARHQVMLMDISQTFYALANALDAKGVLSKTEFAEAMQERLLRETARLPSAVVAQYVLLPSMAKALETSPTDVLSYRTPDA